jgi:hypothetical protein
LKCRLGRFCACCVDLVVERLFAAGLQRFDCMDAFAAERFGHEVLCGRLDGNECLPQLLIGGFFCDLARCFRLAGRN